MSSVVNNVNLSSGYGGPHVDDKILKNIRELAQKIHVLYDGKDGQRRTLIALMDSGSISQRELTEKLQIRPASMSEVLTKLYNKGFIERVPGESDKRTMIISLTEAGRNRARESLEFRTERRVEMFNGLDEEEKDSLLQLLEKINAD